MGFLGLGKKKQQETGSALATLDLFSNAPQRTYDRTGGLTADYVYKPEKLIEQMRSGGYGEPISINEVGCKSPTEGEEFLGVTLRGTPAARDSIKQSIELMYNYGFWESNFVPGVTKEIICVPLTDCYGAGDCPGSTIWVSPEKGLMENVDTIYHEYLHNCGYTAEPEEHQWIYEQAAIVRNYLAQYQGVC